MTAEQLARVNADPVVARSLALIRAAKLRTAEGKRHSAADLQSMADSHQALHDAHSALLDASGMDCDGLVTAGTDATDPNAGADNLPRNAEARLNPPDPYAAALEKRRAAQAPSREAVVARNAEIRFAQHPEADPDYDPRGVPPDPYRIALALRQALKEDTNG